MYVFVNMSLQKYYNLLEILGWPKSSFICEMLWKNPNEFFCWQNITEQRSPSFFSTRDWFYGRQFFHGLGGGGMVLWDSSTLHLLCTLFLFCGSLMIFSLEKEMATHSSLLAWKIPWMEEPGRLQSTGSQSRTQLSNFTWLVIFYLDLWVPVHAPMRVSVTSDLVGGGVQTVMQPWGALWIHVCFRRTAQWFSYAY